MKKISRRRFIRNTLLAGTSLSALPLLKSCTVGANDTIRIGFIGLGRQAINLFNGFSKIQGVQIVAGADVYGIKRQRFENRLNAYYKSLDQSVTVNTYSDYRKIIDRKDIDAVIISTPDHWHYLQGIDACDSRKDIYMEKPITFTIKESIKIAEAVRKSNVVFATGSQQRSDKNFQHAVRMVQEEAAGFGKLEKIYAFVGPGPDPYDLPEEKVPADLDWNTWLGPLPYVHYNSALNPPISLDPPQNETFWANWRYYKETGGGFQCDWGAHNYDIGQWALQKDSSGPVRIIPAGYQGTQYLTYEYDNGVEMLNKPYDEENTRGVKFWGSDGWIEVSRGKIAASDDSLLPKKDEDEDAGLYERSSLHLNNFIECMRTRKEPIANVEIGQRTATCCILGNIAIELRRPVLWSPEKQYFVNDPEAEKYFHNEYRNGYAI